MDSFPNWLSRVATARPPAALSHQLYLLICISLPPSWLIEAKKPTHGLPLEADNLQWLDRFLCGGSGLVPERQEERDIQRRRIGRSALPATQLCLFLSELSGQGSCLFTQPCQLSTFSRALERHPAGGNQSLGHLSFSPLISYPLIISLFSSPLSFLTHSYYLFPPYLLLVWKWQSWTLLRCACAWISFSCLHEMETCNISGCSSWCSVHVRRSWSHHLTIVRE